MPALEDLEAILGYQFSRKEFLTRALTHRSWASDHPPGTPENADNEQLEFLGDSILGFAVSEALVLRNPEAREGLLSQLKAHLVSSSHLHLCALGLKIGDHLILGRGEERNGGRGRKTLLANAMEAIIAAVYLDGGMESARRLVEEHVLNFLDSTGNAGVVGLLNHKSVLQEHAQSLGLPTPQYAIVATSGPEHAKDFTIEARIGDQLASRATGSSKKLASQRAAELLIGRLKTSEITDLAGHN